MGNRFRIAFRALSVVLLITVACVAFMPVRMGDAIEGVADVNRCMVLRYDTQYSTAYPQGEQLEEIKTVLQETTGHFDRNRGGLVYWGGEPLYRIYLWNSNGRISDIWVCGTAIFYDGTQYLLGEEDAIELNAAFESSFKK